MTTKTKKAVKRDINKNGFFINMPMKLKKNVPDEYKDNVPEGAVYFEGIASNGDINRNGYIIRENAWKDAISGYFENPVILLQHDMDKPIGQGIWAKVTKNGLEVGAYVFDEYTDKKFSRGLFRALSTGHYTMEAEFENEETKEVLSEEEFIAKYNPDRSFWTGEIIPPAGWVLAVTKLEWVEFSVVSIGSNRRSMVTHQNAILHYLKNKYEKNTDGDDEEDKEPTDESLKAIEKEEGEDKSGTDTATEDKPVEEPKPDEKGEEKVEVPAEPEVKEEEKKEDVTPDAKNTVPDAIPTEEPVKEGENPSEQPESKPEEKKEGEEEGSSGDPVEKTPEEGAEKKPTESNSIAGLSTNEVKTAFNKLYELNGLQTVRIEELEKENTELRQKLNMPVRKGLAHSGSGVEKQKPLLAQLFENKGIAYRE